MIGIQYWARALCIKLGFVHRRASRLGRPEASIPGSSVAFPFLSLSWPPHCWCLDFNLSQVLISGFIFREPKSPQWFLFHPSFFVFLLLLSEDRSSVLLYYGDTLRDNVCYHVGVSSVQGEFWVCYYISIFLSMHLKIAFEFRVPAAVLLLRVGFISVSAWFISDLLIQKMFVEQTNILSMSFGQRSEINLKLNQIGLFNLLLIWWGRMH